MTSERHAEHPAVAAIRKEGHTKVKVAVSDIDGILRGKLLHRDKFFGAAQPHPAGGFGFCDVVFGWDAHDVCYDNTQVTGWQHGFPDALARLDLDTARRVPWDGGVPFFLGDFVNADGSLGYFQHRFRVYDREGEPCVTPGCGKLVKRLVQSGRSTFYCESCQKRSLR